MGRFSQSFSKIDICFSKGISENSKLRTDLYQKWKIVAAKKRKKRKKEKEKERKKEKTIIWMWCGGTVKTSDF